MMGRLLTGLVLCVTTTFPLFAMAQERIDPTSIEALKRMGDYLANLQTFSVTGDTMMEVVLDTDQKLLIGGTVEYVVRRPDKLRIDLITDVVNRQFIYDGQSATYVAPEEGYYAQSDVVPNTISEMLEQAAQRYSLAFPLADLFAWGTDDAPIDLIREGFHIGQSRIGGMMAEHWGFRGPDQDWEIWLYADGPPLPLRISSVDRNDLTHPRFVVTLDWKEDATAQDAEFSFVPGAEMKRIPLESNPAAVEADR